MPLKLFLLHGMGGSIADWDAVTAKIPSTALPLPEPASSPVQCASALADEIEKSAAGAFALGGYSMGGRLAILTAVELFSRGIPPSKLVLVSAGLGLSSEKERSARNAADAAWADLAARDPQEFWRNWYDQELFASYRALPPDRKQGWEKARLSMNIGRLMGQLRHLGPGRHEHLVPLLEGLLEKGVRVLYIVGELDKKYVELSRIVGEMKGAQVTVIPDAGHILPLETPELLANKIRDFLN